MAWDFETEPEFQAELDWVDEFVRDEVEPLDLFLGTLTTRATSARRRSCDPSTPR